MLEIINKHVAKISLALEEEDSILRLSKKINSSYGWTHKWINRLEDIGVIKAEKGVKIIDKDFFEEFKSLSKSVLEKKIELEDAYLLPNMTGMDYAFTKLDSVFLWTKGGYQIGRSKENYPIFIEVLRNELKDWEEFFKDLSIDYSIEERQGSGIYFVLFPKDKIGSEEKDNLQVIPLKETVRWAKKYGANFQPALEMLDEMYDLDLNIEYKEKKVI